MLGKQRTYNNPRWTKGSPMEWAALKDVAVEDHEPISAYILLQLHQGDYKWLYPIRFVLDWVNTPWSCINFLWNAVNEYSYYTNNNMYGYWYASGQLDAYRVMDDRTYYKEIHSIKADEYLMGGDMVTGHGTSGMSAFVEEYGLNQGARMNFFGTETWTRFTDIGDLALRSDFNPDSTSYKKNSSQFLITLKKMGAFDAKHQKIGTLFKADTWVIEDLKKFIADNSNWVDRWIKSTILLTVEGSGIYYNGRFYTRYNFDDLLTELNNRKQDKRATLKSHPMTREQQEFLAKLHKIDLDRQTRFIHQTLTPEPSKTPELTHNNTGKFLKTQLVEIAAGERPYPGKTQVRVNGVNQVLTWEMMELHASNGNGKYAGHKVKDNGRFGFQSENQAFQYQQPANHMPAVGQPPVHYAATSNQLGGHGQTPVVYQPPPPICPWAAASRSLPPVSRDHVLHLDANQSYNFVEYFSTLTEGQKFYAYSYISPANVGIWRASGKRDTRIGTLPPIVPHGVARGTFNMTGSAPQPYRVFHITYAE